MRILLVALMAMFVMPAFAEHHRGHALMHLETAKNHLDTSILFASIIEANESETDANRNFARRYVIYAQKYIKRMDQAKVILEDPNGDLDEARRKITSPGFGTELDAVDWGMGTIEGIAMLMVNEDITNYLPLRKVFDQERRAGQSVNFVNWHIQDAIREEVYQDPVFICSGPNNHCE